ncbi:uncharacterized protein LOC113559342 [Rhopalosiphum maidis]|uniref:uncharacterized protein LOC113558047 n=1 Tax=Rhopalosiphum maidis TaxID=43146 RepID=UPI000EFE20FB|nr:uncharacterized protein LOC113558047 [Rhopalosiphum maidis]XP_026820886.1 uncharacterized protein LOC113559342 [Rhopalosiphum maidis]
MLALILGVNLPVIKLEVIILPVIVTDIFISNKFLFLFVLFNVWCIVVLFKYYKLKYCLKTVEPQRLSYCYVEKETASLIDLNQAVVMFGSMKTEDTLLLPSI